MPVTILRDTGAYHSLLLESVLPLSEQSSCGSNILVWGIKMSVTSAPVHMVLLQSPLVSGYVKVAVRPRLPIAGVSFILGNDLAGGRVFPSPEVLGIHISAADPASLPLGLFSSCAITWAQARKMEGVVDLENSFLATADGGCGLETSEGSESVVRGNDSAMLPIDMNLIKYHEGISAD